MKDYLTNYLEQMGTKGMDYQMVIMDLIGEFQAIYQYDEHIATTTNTIVKRTLIDIRNEELVHIGMLFGLLQQLKPEYIQYFDAGHQEFLDLTNT